MVALFEQEVIAAIDESGIERLLAAGVQTVVGEVHHLLHVEQFGAYVFQFLGVVGQGEAEAVDVVQVLAAHGDFDHVAGVERFAVGRQHERAAHFVVAVAHAAVEFGGDAGDVVGVDEAVAVDVANADVVEVGVALTQTGVVHVRGEVVLVDALVAVDVALHYTLGAGHLEDVHFAARGKVAHGGVEVDAQVACGGMALEGERLDAAVGLPLEGYGFRPRLAVGAHADGTLGERAVAAVLTR